MFWILLALGTIVTVAGALLLSNATQGVGVIAIGCFLGIAARIVQANAYEKRRHVEHVSADEEVGQGVGIKAGQ